MGLMGCIYLSIKIFYLNSAKDYYFSLYQEIIDSTISFHNVILFQYEELIKYFGEQSYTFITSDLLREKRSKKPGKCCCSIFSSKSGGRRSGYTFE